jgi:hypothetical protein
LRPAGCDSHCIAEGVNHVVVTIRRPEHELLAPRQVSEIAPGLLVRDTVALGAADYAPNDPNLSAPVFLDERHPPRDSTRLPGLATHHERNKRDLKGETVKHIRARVETEPGCDFADAHDFSSHAF